MQIARLGLLLSVVVYGIGLAIVYLTGDGSGMLFWVWMISVAVIILSAVFCTLFQIANAIRKRQ